MGNIRVLLLLMLIMIGFTSFSQDSISALETKVNYYAEDSMIIDVKAKKAYLYNAAHIDYGDYILDACYIEFDMETNQVFARMCFDSLGSPKGIPSLSDGSTETLADSLRFNFQSKRGITYHVKMQEGEGYIHGSKVKRQQNGHIHIDTALYTTCDLPHPHYYFKLRKAIIMPDDKIVSGPINLYIADIPTPLGLPFGFIPNQETKTNGIILPRFGNSPSQGFSLSRGGYYHRFKGERLAITTLGDIFTKGSWGLSNEIDYRTRYKYSGNLDVTYRVTKLGEKEFGDFSKANDFVVKWSHNQDPKSIPSMTFRASLEAGTSTAYKNTVGTVILNANNYLRNNFNSNIAWSKTFKKLPSNLSVNLRHNQNSNNKLVTFTLPDITYNINRFYPGKWVSQKNAVKSKARKQLEKIGITYVANIRNETSAFENQLGFSDMSILKQNMRNGAKHSLNAATSINLLGGAITMTPSINSTALNYFQRTQNSWDEEGDSLLVDTLYQFNMPMWANYRVSFSSKVYGFYEFADFLKGKKKTKIRHMMTPTGGFSLNPDNGFRYQYRRDTIVHYYDPYGTQIFGGAPQGESGFVNFSLINAFEMRQNNQDTLADEEFVYKKLLDNLTFSSGYNILADSLNWSDVSISGRTNIAKKLNTRFGMTLDPYARDTNNRKINTFRSELDGNAFHITAANLAFGFNLKSKRKEDKLESKAGSKEEVDYINNNRDQYIQFGEAWAWDLNFGYNLSYNKIFSYQLGDSARITQTINLNGSMNLTENLNFNFQTNYDLTNQKFSYTSLNIKRDLHCWQMQFNWVPFGFQKSWSIQINVKAAVLQDLKLQKRQIWQDNGVR